MPKPVPLTPEAMEATVTPRTAPPPTTRTATASASAKAPKAAQIPLQLRLPRDEVRTIKIAAAQRDQTLSDSRLHAFMHK